MADKEKIKKKKLRKDEDGDDSRSSVRLSTKSSLKNAKRCGSNVFSMFSTQQVAEFKEGFAMMDKDGDGILGKSDLRATWDQVGKVASDRELQEMLDEASGPVNFTQLLTLFANKMQGGADDDQTVRAAFMTFDENGRINSSKLQRALVTWGDKFSQRELNDAFDVIDVDRNGFIDTDGLVQMLTASGEEE